MTDCGQETILSAVIVSAVAFTIIAVILILMYQYIRQNIDKNSVDNSLFVGLKEDNKLKNIKIKNLEDQKAILMMENLKIADQRNDLAILLNQKE